MSGSIVTIISRRTAPQPPYRNEETERDDEYVPNLGERLPELLAAELGGDPEDYDADAEGKNYSMPDLDTLESISADEFYDDEETEGER